MSGRVLSVSPNGPADGMLDAGDVISSIDGVAPRLSPPLYAGLVPGDTVGFTIVRDGDESSVDVQLAKPPRSVQLQQLLPLVVAFAVWACGTTVLIFGARDTTTWLFLLFCLLFSFALTSGSVSFIGPVWMASLFNISLWWLCPLSIDFHLRFVRDRPVEGRHYGLFGLYGVSALATVPYLRWNLSTLRGFFWYPVCHTASRLALAVGFAGSIVLVVRAYFQTRNAQCRAGIRLVALGSGMALIPFVSLGLVPDVLLGHSLVPYWSLFPSLLSIPAAYGYTILRYRLLQWDRSVNRTTAHIVALILIASTVVTLGSWAGSRLPPGLYTNMLVDLAVVLIVAYLYSPTLRQIQRLVDWTFYGGWYEPQDVIEQSIQGLGQTTNSSELLRMASHRLCDAMKLRCACLMLTDAVLLDVTAAYSSKGGECAIRKATRTLSQRLPSSGNLCRCFDGSESVVSAHDLRNVLSTKSLSEIEQGVLGCEQVRLWVPLFDQSTLLGLLAIGPKLGEDCFDESDRRSLGIIARQVATVLKNSELSQQLRTRSLEIEALHQQLVRLRERERKRIARELHDRVIQELVSMQFQMRRSTGNPSQPLYESIHRLIDELRSLCRELRPPMLDNLGLVPAVRSHIREVAEDASFDIILDVDGDEKRELPEEASLTLFRALQEALINVQRHTAAKRVQVSICIRPETVNLSVCDDGQGFDVPSSFGEFLACSSFGLIGLRERLELVGGELRVISAPARGTELLATIPLNGSEDAKTQR